MHLGALERIFRVNVMLCGAFLSFLTCDELSKLGMLGWVLVHCIAPTQKLVSAGCRGPDSLHILQGIHTLG